MAKTNENVKNEKLEGYNPRMYLQMKIVYVALAIINIIVVLVSFYKLGWAMYDAQRGFGYISRANEDLLQTNSAVLMMINDVEQTDSQSQRLGELFQDIGKSRGEFAALGDVDKDVEKQFDEALTAVNSYKDVLMTIRTDYEMAHGDQAKLAEFAEGIYPQYKAKIEPKMNEATDKMNQTVEAQKESALNTFFTKAQSVVIVLALMILILVIGIIAITMMQRAAKRAAVELQKRAEEIEETSKKLFASRNKTKAIAFTNVLTGLKNRYALEEDVGSRLEGENFNLCNFDFDNFRNFNEVYGRDFGDEFLSVISERLKNEFSEYAEIYNITVDEFLFVFKENVNSTQANELTQKIFGVLTASYTVYNVTVQMTASGCSYHYIAGECMSLNSLLSKMDATMHNAKNNGGNTVLEVERL